VTGQQIGNGLWVHPETPAELDLALWLQQFYPNNEVLPADFLADRMDQPPQERGWT
jgi:antitoxin VapB